jgi:uncharacterized protein
MNDQDSTSMKFFNRLQLEKSPYLLQHATNPVDWYPWGDAAFEKATREDKPIFLSIGYSTCHWCHVMEKESFEDREVAAMLNEAFVCIKVDREERPDIDGIYMAVCQVATGSGGWPLTILMTPDKTPFFAGTYIPKEGKYGRAGLKELVPQVAMLWNTRREELLKAARLTVEHLSRFTSVLPGKGLKEDLLHEAYQDLKDRFDSRQGGFGTAPKFPTPHNMTFLLRYWKRTGSAHALDMVIRTLDAMAHGGIYDHVGFGFHRYSTDDKWLVPHFEKMLYDQALLALAYLEAYQATHKTEYADVAKEIFAYVLRDMTGPEDGFYSAQDADSEGVEGRFYVWSENEIRHVLEPDTAELVIRYFGVKPEGNWTDPTGHGDADTNILHLSKPMSELAAGLNRTSESLKSDLENARQQLIAVREMRVHPHTDDKVLTDWNGLMIAALARGSQVLGDSRYGKAAQNAASFIISRMKDESGRLLHRYRDGEVSITANLDDYAFLVWGLIELYEATFTTSYLAQAIELNFDLLSHFWDDENGGFFFTPDDGEKLLVRQKDTYDGAIPSGNSVAMLNLLHLSRITGDSAFEAKADQLGRALSAKVEQYPAGHTQLLSALTFALGPSKEIVLTGHQDSDQMHQMLCAIRSHFIPEKVVIARHERDGLDGPPIEELAPFVKSYGLNSGEVLAYVCSNHTCALPTGDPEKMIELLE